MADHNKHDVTDDHSDDEDENSNSYAIIDMTEPIPKCVNYTGPDIIRDLPPGSKPRNKIGRSSSFLSQSTGEFNPTLFTIFS